MTAPPPLSPGWRKAVVATAAGVAVLGLIGFLNSFIAVSNAVAPSFDLPWTVPFGIDVAIAVFSSADLIMARLAMRTRWLRLVPWALVAATIYLNVAAETTWVGWVAHTALPALWVVAVEVGTHVVRAMADLASPRRMERIRRARWLLAPLPTAAMYRRMVLWETRSYDEALALERSRLLARAHMREAYGRRWRWKAPPRVRVLYRLGESAPVVGAPERAADAPSSGLAPLFLAPPAPINAPVPRRGANVGAFSAPTFADQRADRDDRRAAARPHGAPTFEADATSEIDMLSDLLARPGVLIGAENAPGENEGTSWPTKRDALEALLDKKPPADDETDYAIGRRLAPVVDLNEGTARRYVADWREKRAAARNRGALIGAKGRATQNGALS